MAEPVLEPIRVTVEVAVIVPAATLTDPCKLPLTNEPLKLNRMSEVVPETDPEPENPKLESMQSRSGTSPPVETLLVVPLICPVPETVPSWLTVMSRAIVPLNVMVKKQVVCGKTRENGPDPLKAPLNWGIVRGSLSGTVNRRSGQF